MPVASVSGIASGGIRVADVVDLVVEGVVNGYRSRLNVRTDDYREVIPGIRCRPPNNGRLPAPSIWAAFVSMRETNAFLQLAPHRNSQPAARSNRSASHGKQGANAARASTHSGHTSLRNVKMPKLFATARSNKKTPQQHNIMWVTGSLRFETKRSKTWREQAQLTSEHFISFFRNFTLVETRTLDLASPSVFLHVRFRHACHAW